MAHTPNFLTVSRSPVNKREKEQKERVEEEEEGDNKTKLSFITCINFVVCSCIFIALC
jgi:hypothetical protein